jgi:hypothetical protein
VKDWVAWHAAYDDPSASLSVRLQRVRSHLWDAIGRAPASGVSLVSLAQERVTTSLESCRIILAITMSALPWSTPPRTWVGRRTTEAQVAAGHLTARRRAVAVAPVKLISTTCLSVVSLRAEPLGAANRPRPSSGKWP